jgi:hypothetical protein
VSRTPEYNEIEEVASDMPYHIALPLDTDSGIRIIAVTIQGKLHKLRSIKTSIPTDVDLPKFRKVLS